MTLSSIADAWGDTILVLTPAVVLGLSAIGGLIAAISKWIAVRQGTLRSPTTKPQRATWSRGVRDVLSPSRTMSGGDDVSDRQQAVWNERASSWEHYVEKSPAFDQVRRRLLDLAHIDTGETAVDLGAGTGFVTIPVARCARQVIAVDSSGEMLRRLAQRVAEARLSNVTVTHCDISQLRIAPGSVDVVLTNYALHHLDNLEKAELVTRVQRWLRPGGRFVIGDMMFGRGLTRRDRRVLRSKVWTLARRGPAGWWRLVRNITRFGLGLGHDRPVTPRFWVRTLEAAGFERVASEEIVAEAAIVVGWKRSDASA